MAESVRTQAINVAVDRLAESDGAWRRWGLKTIVRTAIKAMEDAGYEVRLIDGEVIVDPLPPPDALGNQLENPDMEEGTEGWVPLNDGSPSSKEG